MKKSFLILVIAGFLLIGLYEIQAQTTQAKPNQVELMKQIIGNWKAELSKDTIYYENIKAFGTGLEFYDKIVVKGKMISEEKELYGYDSKLDKYVGADLVKGKDIIIYAMWFVSNTKFEGIHYSDISNPDKASFRVEGEFKSPDAFSLNFIMNGNVVLTYNFKRIK
jgi:hypothetical protein